MSSNSQKAKKSRVIGKIEELIDSGYRSFFINKSNEYREHYYDDFFSKKSKQPEKIDTCLRHYFLDREKKPCLDLFMAIVPGETYPKYEITLYNRERQIDFDDEFSASNSGLDISAAKKPENSSEKETEEEKAQKRQTGEWGEVKRKVDRVLDSDKKVAIYIDGIDDLAKIYDSEKNLECIKTLKDWENFERENKFLVCSLEKIQTYKDDYTIDFEKKKNFFHVGTPKSNEIYFSILNLIAEKTGRKTEELEDDKTLLPCDDPFNYFLNAIADLAETEQKCLYQILEFCRQNLGTLLKEKHGGIHFFEDRFISPENKREKIELKDITLEKGIKESIERTVQNFLTGDAAKKAGIILYGPPGTGKSEIAKAIAHQFKCAFKAVTITDLKKGYVGQSGQAVKELYDELELMDPVILFIDEIDSIFSMRNSQHGDSFTSDIVNAMLPRIDGFKSKLHDIFIVGATNNYENLDSAIISRLESISIDLPSVEARKEIFLTKLKGKDGERELQLVLKPEKFDLIVRKKMDGFTGRDILHLVKTLREGRFEEVNEGAVDDALRTFVRDSFANMKRDFPSMVVDPKNPEELQKNPKAMDQIIAMEAEKKQLAEHFDCLEMDAQGYEMYLKEVGVNKGILLHGAPGNGKSYLMGQIARHYGLVLVKALAKDILSPSRVHPLFDTVYKVCKILSESSGVLLFFDEMDSLLREGASSEIRATFLDCLADKKYRNLQNLFISGATNFYYGLDQAAIRTGRFDLKLPINGITEANVFRRFLESKLGKEYNLAETETDGLFQIMRELKQFHMRKQSENAIRSGQGQAYDATSAVVAVSDVEEIAQRIKRAKFNPRDKRDDTNQEKIEVEQALINLIIDEKNRLMDC